MQRTACGPGARCSCPVSSASTASSRPAGRRADRRPASGATARPRLGGAAVSLLRLLRALSPQEVACVISILLRLRYAGARQQASPARPPRLAARSRSRSRRLQGLPGTGRRHLARESGSVCPARRLLAGPSRRPSRLADAGAAAAVHRVPAQQGIPARSGADGSGGTPGRPQHPRRAPRVAGGLPGLAPRPSRHDHVLAQVEVAERHRPARARHDVDVDAGLRHATAA